MLRAPVADWCPGGTAATDVRWEVLNLSDSSNTLTILGDSDDSVDIGAGWTSQGTAVFAFSIYFG